MILHCVVIVLVCSYCGALGCSYCGALGQVFGTKT